MSAGKLENCNSRHREKNCNSRHWERKRFPEKTDHIGEVGQVGQVGKVGQGGQAVRSVCQVWLVRVNSMATFCSDNPAAP